MSVFQPNKQQQQAIEQLAGDLVIAAGAGSGKTAVLARRFVHAMTRDDDQWPASAIDEILTITFTRKAAAELRERVRRVLIETGESGVKRSRQVDEAWISTIDAFCARVLRRHALECGLDPRARYASEIESARLRMEAARAVVDDGLARSPHDGVSRYAPATLRERLAEDLQRLRKMGRAPRELRTVGQPDLARELAEVRASVQLLLDKLQDLGPSLGKTQTSNAQQAAAFLEELATMDLVSPETAATRLLELGARTKFKANAEPREQIYAAREAIEHSANCAADVVLAPYALDYRELLEEYSVAYSARKARAGVIDFEDAVELVARLLEERADIAARYREHFATIMVDEFQDTDALQMRAVDALCDDNLCAVGDTHQSIYGFRFADVGVMRDLVKRVGSPISMYTNYRSHPDVLHAVNALFADEAFFGDDEAALEPGHDTVRHVEWPAGTARVEAHMVDQRVCGAGERPIREAMAMSQRVRTLVDDGVAPHDIVVLLRGMTHAPTIAGAMRSCGIPAHVASGEKLFETPEVTDVRALLRATAVPTDDAAMLRVLAGPVAGLSDGALLAIRAAADRDSLWDGLRRLATEADADHRSPAAADATSVFDAIEVLRDRLGSEPLGDFVHRAIHEFDYDLTLLAAGTQGAQAWANATKLVRMADEFERAHGGDVGAFLAYLADYEQYVSREPVAPATAAEGAVRIMSIHAAKGLEFPVVIVGDLGRRLLDSCQGPFLVDRVDGEPVLAVEHPRDATVLEGLKDTLFEEVKASRDEAEQAEARRLLYVAMTRAQDALLLVGTADPTCQERRTPSDLVLAALGNPDASGVIDVSEGRIALAWHADDIVAEGGPHQSAIPVAEPSVAQRLEAVVAPDEAEPPAEPGPRTPPTVSYSALHSFGRCPRRFYVAHVLGMRRLTRDAAPALTVGSAVHQALQSADPHGAAPAAAARLNLDDDEKQRLLGAVESFAISTLRAELDQADELHAEWPISVDLGDSRLVGSMDVMARNGDAALIVDYKTGQDIEASRSEERMSGYRLQARCYALAALRGGAQTVRVVFAFVEQAMGTVEFEFEAEDESMIAEDMGDRLESIARSSFPPLEKYDVEVCRGCEALGVLCPILQPPPAA